MEVIAIVGAVVGAVGDIEAAKAQEQQYRLQAKQTKVESQRKAIQYEQQAVEVLRRRNEANAALAARAYAGGIDPFSGSPDIVRAANETTAGREYALMLANADAAIRAGRFQAEVYKEAGRTAMEQGKFSAATKLISGAVSAYSLGTRQVDSSAAAPITKSAPAEPGAGAAPAGGGQ